VLHKLFAEMIEGYLKNNFSLHYAGVLFCVVSLLFFNEAAYSEDIVVFSVDTQSLDLTNKLHPMASARTKITLDVVDSNSTAKDTIALVASQAIVNTTWYIVTLKNDSQFTRNTVLSLRDSNVTAVFASGGRGKISGPHENSVSVKLEPAATITLALESATVPKNVLLQDAALLDGINSRSSLMTLFAISCVLVFAGFATVFYFWKTKQYHSKVQRGNDTSGKKFERHLQRQSVLGAVIGKDRGAVSPTYLETFHTDKIYNSIEDEHTSPDLAYGKKEVDRDWSNLKDLRAAFERGQIIVCFQPIFRLSDCRIEGIEASIQWLHPDHGILSWQYITAIAANDPILEQLDRYIMGIAVKQVGIWNKKNPKNPSLNLIINVGGAYSDAKSFCKDFSYLALRNGLLRNMITIQVHSASLELNRENIQQFACQVKSLGIGFSAGNFGGNGSDFFVLRNFDFDCVSLDASLLKKDFNERHSIGFLKATMDYLRNLSDKIIVTGILDEVSLRAAYQLGCKYGRGYPFEFLLTSDNLFEFLDYNINKQMPKQFNIVS
jgi:EAL domain-containing protein (putative c-di-GMP-specific phosphodiesterase class I)